MNQKYVLLGIALIIFSVFSCQTEKTGPSMSEMYTKSAAVENTAPEAKKIAKELEIHGDVRIDNYYWLNDRENPEVISHLEAENDYRENMMSHLKE